MEQLIQDTNIWVLVSFLLFAVIILRLGKGAFLGKLDGRIAEIRADIETAEKLRAEAQELLSNYQVKKRDAAEEAQQIIAKAKLTAEDINKQAKLDLEEMLSRKEAQLAERLKRMEEAAKAEIQAHAAELAIKATAEIIAASLDAESNSRLVDMTIQSLPKELN